MEVDKLAEKYLEGYTDGKCKECPYMELDVDVAKYWLGGKPLIAGISAKCIKEDLCNALKIIL